MVAVAIVLAIAAAIAASILWEIPIVPAGIPSAPPDTT